MITNVILSSAFYSHIRVLPSRPSIRPSVRISVRPDIRPSVSAFYPYRYVMNDVTQPETPQTCCKLRNLPNCCNLSSSCSKPVDFIKLQQVCEYQTCCNLIFADLRISSCSKSVVATCSKSVERINADASCENQTCCKLIFADLLQVVSTTCSKLVDNKS